MLQKRETVLVSFKYIRIHTAVPGTTQVYCTTAKFCWPVPIERLACCDEIELKRNLSKQREKGPAQMMPTGSSI